MKISLNWLQDFVEITEKNLNKVQEVITARTAEIETIEKLDTPLNDTVLDIDNHTLTHRWDLFSHYGFAREMVANGLAKWKKKKPFSLDTINTPAPMEVKIHEPSIERYLGVYITGIQVGQSPEWIQRRLTAIGIRPINNIVDITNYVMMEYGTPNHAFDVEQVSGKTWIMRKAKKGEHVVTLDQKKIELTPDVTVFDDGNDLFDLCGIMGGYQSGINESTQKLWLHVPVYRSTTIRTGSKITGQKTDAAVIYEKGVDPETAWQGLTRLVELILECCPEAQVASKVLDIKNYEEKLPAIALRPAQIERLLGVAISESKMKKILSDLGFEVSGSGKTYKVVPPSWRRNSVTMEADVIEEVGRIYGYDKVKMRLPGSPAKPVPTHPERRLIRDIKQFLVGRGFSETCTFSFLGKELIQKAGGALNDEIIEIENPLSGDMALMRQNLLPRLLETVSDNLRYRNEFRLFELAKLHFKKGEGVDEPLALIAATVGEPFRVLQGVTEAMLQTNGLPGVRFQNADTMPARCHPGRAAEVILRNKIVGRLYELHPEIASHFDIGERVTIVELDFETLLNMPRAGKMYQEIPRFPAIVMDISILIPEKKTAREYAQKIGATDKRLIENVELKDEYAGKNIPAGKRSLTYGITYRLPDRTLTETEVNPVHEKVLKALKSAGVEIR